MKEKIEEIENWKSRNGMLEKNNQLQIDELTVQLENKKKSEVDMNVREVSAKFNLETSSLENQLKIHKQKISDLENKCIILGAEIERLVQLNLERMNEVDSWKIKYGNLDKNTVLRMEELTIHYEIQKKNEMVHLK